MEQKVVFVSNNDTELYQSLVKDLVDKDLTSKFQIKQFSCFGLNTYNSIIEIHPGNVRYVNYPKEKIGELVDSELLKGKSIDQYLYKHEEKDFIGHGPMPIYHKQLRLVLRNSGLVDPESLDSYLTRDGFKGMAKAISEMTPEEALKEMEIANIRGRGGAGFPTWLKWKFTKEVENDVKYIVCNADEGDPGAYMDRSVLESDPYSILEGMAIGAYIIGAKQGYLYVRAEYPLAIERLEKAIDACVERGLLGDNILGTDFSFNLEIRLGAGAFVCGEETALLASIEGSRGMPRPRPPFPSVKGLWGKPTVINNVETLANVPLILNKGGAWYAKIGTEKSKGTKVFALTGKVKNSGLVEVPMGTTLREIIFDVGCGILDDKGFKAVQTGGPSGGVIAEKFLDTPISYESLAELGSIMGSGGMIVMDKTDCMVDISQFYLQFSVDESCGKCSPCRIGGKQTLALLDDITKGKADDQTIPKLRSIGKAMQKASLCGLGQTAPNPVLSTLEHFMDEYEAHIKEDTCPSGKCKALVKFSIVDDKCIGCGLCARKCPVTAITGEKKQTHVIDHKTCIKCGVCFDVCNFNAVVRS